VVYEKGKISYNHRYTIRLNIKYDYNEV